MAKQGIKHFLFAASFVGTFTILADGWQWKLIGVISVLYMFGVTIATAIDEKREDKWEN